MVARQENRFSTPQSSAARSLPATYQTRIRNFSGMDPSAGEDLLSAYALLYGRVERRLFGDTFAGRPASSLKSHYLEGYRLQARMFNGVRVSLEGKVASVREQQQLQMDGLKRRIVRAEGQIFQAGPAVRREWLHQKKRRLSNLKARVEKLEGDIADGRVRLCFGSRGLWRKQYRLEANGYASHHEWLKEWQSAKSNEFFVLGRRDETAGCQLCVATVADDGSLTLRLRLPDALAGEQGKYLTIVMGQFGLDDSLVSRAWCPIRRRRQKQGPAETTNQIGGIREALTWKGCREPYLFSWQA